MTVGEVPKQAILDRLRTKKEALAADLDLPFATRAELANKLDALEKSFSRVEGTQAEEMARSLKERHAAAKRGIWGSLVGTGAGLGGAILLGAVTNGGIGFISGVVAVVCGMGCIGTYEDKRQDALRLQDLLNDMGGRIARTTGCQESSLSASSRGESVSFPLAISNLEQVPAFSR